jgi:hypothetical protein
MNMYLKSLLLSLIISTAAVAASVETYTIQQKAMGGVSVATYTDVSQFQSNPAKLGLIDGIELNLLNLEGGINKELHENMSDIQALMDETDESKQIEMLKDLTPMKIGAKVSALPILSFSKKNFGISIISKGQINGRLKRKSAPGLELSGQTDTNFVLGFSKPVKIKNRPVIIGLSPKYVSRATIYDKVTGVDEIDWTQAELLRLINGIDELDVDTYKVSGFGLDAGLLMPFESKRTAGFFGVSVKNIVSGLSGTKDRLNKTSDITTRDPFGVTVGTSFDTPLPLIRKTTIAADYNLIDSNGGFFKRLHFGVEKKLTILSLRAGVNQGYIGGGFGLDLKIFTVNYAFFGEELGEKIGHNELLTHNVQLGFTF